jgi:hypothetical protein
VLIDTARRNDFFADPVWFEFLMVHFYPGPHQVKVYAVEDADSGTPLLLMPLRLCMVDYSAVGARSLGAISHPENYAPVSLIFAAGQASKEALLIFLFRALRRSDTGVDMLRLWPLHVGSETGDMLRRALKRAGFWLQIYANSHNRYENTAGLGYDKYFANRSANLRYSVRRRQRALEKSGLLEMSLYRTSEGLEEVIADYVSVSLASWKEPDSMVSDDMLALIRLTAESGCLRLGVLRHDGVAAAVQFWIVADGVAYCSRLAYREDFKERSPGVVLTNFMIQHLLDGEGVERIDFGYGEEDYKSGWMNDAREYQGVLAFNPYTRKGFVHGLKNIIGRPVKRFAKKMLVMLRSRNATPVET